MQTHILEHYFYDLSSTCNRMQQSRAATPCTMGKEGSVVAAIFCFHAAACFPPVADGEVRESMGSGLFYITSKASHSCCPNAYSYTIDRSGRKILRSIQPIRFGEEVTVSDDLRLELKPRHERQESLRQAYGFLCSCDRCALPDDTRPFPCRAPKCKGRSYLQTCSQSGEGCFLLATSAASCLHLC